MGVLRILRTDTNSKWSAWHFSRTPKSQTSKEARRQSFVRILNQYFKFIKYFIKYRHVSQYWSFTSVFFRRICRRIMPIFYWGSNMQINNSWDWHTNDVHIIFRKFKSSRTIRVKISWNFDNFFFFYVIRVVALMMLHLLVPNNFSNFVRWGMGCWCFRRTADKRQNWIEGVCEICAVPVSLSGRFKRIWNSNSGHRNIISQNKNCVNWSSMSGHLSANLLNNLQIWI